MLVKMVAISRTLVSTVSPDDAQLDGRTCSDF
jgi:hypothetical protein